MGVLRRVRLVTRMTAGFAAVLLCVVGIWLVALSSAAQTRSANASLSQAVARVDAAMQVKFRSADFNGWQTAYAFDIIRGAPGATADSAPSRAAYLAAMESFSTELDTLTAQPLSTADADAAQAVRTTYNEFAATDQEVIAAYRVGTASQTAAANDLVLGREIKLFQQVSGGIDKLVAAARADAAAAARSASAAANSTGRLATTLGIVALLGSLLIAVALTRSITGPLGAIGGRLADIAEGEGDLTQRLDVGGRDEFTAVSRSFNGFVEKIADTVRRITTAAATVTTASEHLTANAAQIVTNAEETSTRSGLVGTAAAEVTRNVQTVAAGAEQMSASIREISSNAAEAARVGEETTRAAQASGDLIGRLGESSQRIGDVVKAITAIAEQTNLLALNATIEAARAGAAGKGFAVVASEVKDLAQETSRATEDIHTRVLSIQRDTAAATDAINEIVEIAGRLGDYQHTIASAVEEQTATTNEMSRSIAEAAVGSAGIATTIAGIATAAQNTSTGITDSRAATEELSRMSYQLRELVGQFRV